MANLSDPFGNGFDLIELAGDGYESLEIPPPSRSRRDLV
jgi:hypothetical protein